MLQAVLLEPRKIIFREVEMPVIDSKHVLLKVKRVGICGSDIDAYRGEHPYTKLPVIQGHEVSAEVVDVGKEVKGFEPGDRVVIRPQIVCNRCSSCLRGDYHICKNLKVIGFQSQGCASEFVSLSPENLMKISKDVSFDIATLCEPLAVAVHALKKTDGGKNAVVLGAGTIGNLVAQCAKEKGMEVAITDISEYRLKIARDCGIENVINARRQEVCKEIEHIFGEADVIFECVGIEDTINQAILCSRPGGKIVVVGVYPKTVNVNIGLVQNWELKIEGTLMYKKEDFEESIKLIEKKRLIVDRLITNRFKFRDYNKAYRFIEESGEKHMKVIVEVG